MKRIFTSCLVSLPLLLGKGQHLLAFPTVLTDRRRAGLVVLVPFILVCLNRRSLDIKNKIKNSLKNGKWEPFYLIKNLFPLLLQGNMIKHVPLFLAITWS